MSASPRVRVSIGIATCFRPKGLERVLSSLCSLTGLDYPEGPVDLRVFVVDNDEKASAEEVVRSFRSSSNLKIEYFIEPRRGIPFARNCFVKNALESSDWLIFLDDDETVDPDWLHELLKAARTFQVDVIAGPVFPEFTSPPPEWAVLGGFFERVRYPTGHLLESAATNNTMVHARVFDGVHPWFDERMSLMGGSDRQFFMRVFAAGFRLIWCDTAVAREYYPPSRVNPRWLYQRMYRLGNSALYVRRDLWSFPRIVFHTFGSVGSASLRGILWLAWSLIPGRKAQCRKITAIRFLCYAAGQVTGAFGIWFFEYRNIHGD